jgi:hypothetical protein
MFSADHLPALEDRPGEFGSTDLHKGMASAQAYGVETLGHKFLPGPALAGNQDGARLVRSEPLDECAERAGGGGIPNELGGVLPPRLVCRQALQSLCALCHVEEDKVARRPGELVEGLLPRRGVEERVIFAFEGLAQNRQQEFVVISTEVSAGGRVPSWRGCEPEGRRVRAF